ncbi:MAG: hypothetical protein DDT21_01880 [Syntrophomonadaceae bacterium]|nr:hypothetical protein [Bacillota bacterium]
MSIAEAREALARDTRSAAADARIRAASPILTAEEARAYAAVAVAAAKAALLTYPYPRTQAEYEEQQAPIRAAERIYAAAYALAPNRRGHAA